MHAVPSADSTYDLGLTGTRWRNVYADTLYGDGSNLTGISVGVPGISTTGLSGFNHVNVGGAMTCTGTIVNKIDATTENAVIIGFEANKNNTNTDGSVIIAVSKQLFAGSFSAEKFLKVLMTSLTIF